jgi:hypothetical protein
MAFRMYQLFYVKKGQANGPTEAVGKASHYLGQADPNRLEDQQNSQLDEILGGMVERSCGLEKMGDLSVSSENGLFKRERLTVSSNAQAIQVVSLCQPRKLTRKEQRRRLGHQCLSWNHRRDKHMSMRTLYIF